jgi:hypothetical protein
MKWTEFKKGTEWRADPVGNEEKVPARIVRLTDANKKDTFFCYRGGKYLDCAATLALAKAHCEAGEGRTNRKAAQERIKQYVDNHPGEIPPFLRLTKEERDAIWKQYPASAPSASRVRLAEAKPGEDPATAALRAERMAKLDSKKDKGGKRERSPAPSGKLARLREGNPKKAGSAAHGRWAALLAAADAGHTTEKFVKSGGNPDTLANAVRMGWVSVQA